MNSPTFTRLTQAAFGFVLVVLAIVLVGCTCEAPCFPYCSDDAGVDAQTDAR